MEPQNDQNVTRKSPPREAGETLKSGATAAGRGAPVPARLGRFGVQRLLGKGAFGSVYLATDPTLSREVAIKVPHEGLTLALRERFLREARATAAIHHPNVCPIFEVGMQGEIPFLVMHYVSGMTLASYLNQQDALPPLQAVAVAQKLAEGIAAAHEKGVTHRDLKPQNVLLDPAKMQPVITDFGLAMLASEAQRMADGAVMGTPAYMSPEQARGKANEIGPLSDVYALGVILYHMLAGEVPFRGITFAVLAQHAKAAPVPPSHVRPGLDPRLDALVLKAMAKKPVDRFGSAQEFATALANYSRTAESPEATAGVTSTEPQPPEQKVRQQAPAKPGAGSGSHPTQPPVKKALYPLPPPDPTDAGEEAGLLPDEDEAFDRSKRRAKVWLVAASAFLAVLTVLVVALALRKPRNERESPNADATAGAKGGSDTAPRTDSRPVVPDPPAPKPKDKVTDPVVIVKPKEDDKKGDPVAVKPKDAEPIPPPRPVNADKWDDAPPSAVRDAIGRVATENALVVSYRTYAGGKGEWVPLPYKPATEPKGVNSVFSTDPVMALPGYKASVYLGEIEKPAVDVLLWGNVPEQFPYRVFESKVVFHQPPAEFDADLTLHAGRIYLKSVKRDADKKSLPAKVRVRLAGTKQVWDVTLPDANADVLVELISWYKPGTPFALKGGAEPRREARVAVVRGPAGFGTTGDRFKKADKIDSGMQVHWDSLSDRLSDPTPSANLQETARNPTLDGEFQKVLYRFLTDVAKPIDGPDSLRVVLKDRMDVKPAATRGELENAYFAARLAIYSWGALAVSTEIGAQTLQPLVDILNSQYLWQSRQAVVTALVQWVSRDVGNTALLHALVSKPDTGVQPPSTADAVVEMLRGYVSPVNPDPSALDTLVARLAGANTGDFARPGKALALRDVALWNLAVADQGLWVPAPFLVNVADLGDRPDDPKYLKFVESWRRRVAEIKKRPKTP